MADPTESRAITWQDFVKLACKDFVEDQPDDARKWWESFPVATVLPKGWDGNVRCPGCRLRFFIGDSVGLHNKVRDDNAELEIEFKEVKARFERVQNAEMAGTCEECGRYDELVWQILERDLCPSCYAKQEEGRKEGGP